MLIVLLKGFIIGLSIAMPIGPIAMLLIRNTLERGFKFGLAVGLGAALIEGFYSLIAASGFAIIAQLLNDYLIQIKLSSALLLIVLGIFEIKNSSANSSKEIKIKQNGFAKTVILVALLTAANPMTIVYFTGVFAAISSNNFDFLKVILISIGAFLGSISWTTFLSYSVSKMRHKISPKWVKIIRIISGLMICLFGIYGIINSLSFSN